MKILFINPPYVRFKNIENIYFPLGLGYLSAMAKQAGHQAVIYNAEIPAPDEKAKEANYGGQLANLTLSQQVKKRIYDYDDPIWKEIRHVIATEKPAMVGIGTVTVALGVTKRIAELVKAIDKNIKVVIGGPHASVDPRSCFTENIDFVITGEGEIPLKGLIDFLEGEKTFEDIGSIVSKKGSEFIFNDKASMIENIDTLPFSDRDGLLNVHNYQKTVFSTFMTDLIGSRGCPFNCKFCSVKNVWGKTVRFRSPDNVAAEMEHMQKNYGSREFHIWDDTFTLNKDYFYRFCDVLISKKSPFLWSCATRVDLLSHEALKKMKQAGCFTVFLGIESGSKKTLDQIDKNISLDKVLEAQDLLKRAKMPWKAYFIVGFPDETKSDMAETFSFMKKIKPSRLFLNVFAPYPGTQLYDRCEELGFLKNVDWDVVETKGGSHNFANAMDPDDFKKQLKDMSKYVDDYNKAQGSIFKKLSLRYSYMSRHPLGFINRIARYAIKRTILGWNRR